MRLTVKGVAIELGVPFAGVLALMLVSDGSGIAAAALAACLFHECGHLLCLIIMGDFPLTVRLTCFGMCIERAAGTGVSVWGEIIAALGGPAVNLLLFVCLVPAARFRVCAAVNLLCGAFNLLPCLPLDGGRVLYFALCALCDGARVCRVCTAVSRAIALLCAVGGVLLAARGNLTLLAAGSYLIFSNMCKRGYPV